MNREQAKALLPEYALEILSERDKAAVREWLADPEMQAELHAIQGDLSQLAVALPPVAPSDDVRARLLASAAGPDRYSAVMADIARVCDLAVEKVRTVVRQLDEGEWLPGPMPGILIQHFDHGPASLGADTGFVRYPPNFAFPRHRHVGREITIVLDGGFTDHDGKVYRCGDVLEYEDGTEHHFTVGTEGLTMVICFTGFEPV